MVFCTAYALILPAITLEHSCGIPEHQHTEECLASGPSCTYRAHRHAQDCYDGSGALSCGEAGFVVHRHDVACYDASGKLWCSMPEIEVHTHSAGCYAQPAADEKEEPLPETTTEPEPAAEPTDPVTEENARLQRICRRRSRRAWKNRWRRLLSLNCPSLPNPCRSAASRRSSSTSTQTPAGTQTVRWSAGSWRYWNIGTPKPA